MLVVDASVTASWIFPDEASAYADRVLDYVRRSGALVPELWLYETANTLLVGERRGRLNQAQTARALADLERFPIQIASGSSLATIQLLLGLGRQEPVSAYDASYMHLAMRERLPLATIDQRLAAAARSLGVTIFT